MRWLILVALVGLAVSCTSALDESADLLNITADQCLLDVRDRGQTYRSSVNCRYLSALTSRHIENGGFKTSTPLRVQVKEATAQKTAWCAMAVSISGDGSLRIW